MRFEFFPERALKIGHARIPVKFIGTKAIQKSFDKGVYEQAQRVANLPKIASLAFMPDAHVGIGTCIGTMAAWREEDALLSPSICGVDIGCGMRLVRTPLKVDEADRSVLRDLMDEIERRIPMGVGKKAVNDKAEVNALLRGDLISVPTFLDGTYGEPVPGSFYRLTEIGNEVSEKAWSRGYDTLGTLGGGNHFIEIQKIEVVDPTAEQWGLFDGQMVIEIHSGSRGFGHQIAEEYIASFGKTMDRQGITREDRNLVYAPLETKEAQAYFKAQKVACNFSVANRLFMSRHVHEALNLVFKLKDGVSDLCDIIHNYITQESGHVVHRKGATAAYPQDHYLLRKSRFKETGFPVLIPGSMGTASYILQPLPAAEETFYTVNHGAGRAMSRREARRTIRDDSFKRQMKDILVNEANLRKIKDEAPDAYKDIDEVIESVEIAKLAKVVARCTPVGVMKGD